MLQTLPWTEHGIEATSHIVSLLQWKTLFLARAMGYAEVFAPHITISRSEEATLIINEVAKEDESVYKFTVRFLTLGDRRISRNFSLEVRGKITVKGWYYIFIWYYCLEGACKASPWQPCVQIYSLFKKKVINLQIQVSFSMSALAKPSRC